VVERERKEEEMAGVERKRTRAPWKRRGESIRGQSRCTKRSYRSLVGSVGRRNGREGEKEAMGVQRLRYDTMGVPCQRQTGATSKHR
jgi:hypothetical protein